MEERYKMLSHHVQTKDFKNHLNHKISDMELGEGVFIKCACLSVCICDFSPCVCVFVCVPVKSVPCIGNTLHDSLVSPHGYTGVLGGNDDGRGNGVCGSPDV